MAGVSETRLTRFGRSAFATVLAFDSPAYRGKPPSRYLTVGRNVIPGWSLALFAVGLILPAVVAAVDAAARARRRGAPLGPWLRWSLAAALPFVVIVLATLSFELVGWLPDRVEEIVAPASRLSLGEALPPLLALVVLFTLSWLTVRRVALGDLRIARVQRDAATTALALMLSLEVLVVCAVNPFAALLLIPAAHLCVLTAMSERPGRTFGAAATAAALALPALALLYYGARFDLGLSLDNYALMVASSAAGSLPSAILGSLVAGSLVSSAILAFGGDRSRAQPAVTVRGPITYAGPGSLGGTESALRR
jgi:hypothetical protein